MIKSLHKNKPNCNYFLDKMQIMNLVINFYQQQLLNFYFNLYIYKNKLNFLKSSYRLDH